MTRRKQFVVSDSLNHLGYGKMEVRVGLSLNNGSYDLRNRSFLGFTSGVRDTGQIISKYPTWMTQHISHLSIQHLVNKNSVTLKTEAVLFSVTSLNFNRTTRCSLRSLPRKLQIYPILHEACSDITGPGSLPFRGNVRLIHIMFRAEGNSVL